jgi:16S rRNA (guanine1207-N2)-methyltransferase
MSDHYFSATPESAASPRTVRFEAYGASYELDSSTGVFSSDRLDLGTSVLMREAPLPARAGTFLDLGCGWGPIACVLADRVPGSTVWAVDVNTRALELAASNARKLELPVRTALPDDVPEDVEFDEIWSNPPIRVGKAALHELLERWLPRLRPDGVAWLVVGKNLGADSLQRWLNERGMPTTRLTSRSGYRVLAVEAGAGA